jgi:uncharacterized membrane protein (UPF0127 family)
MIRALLQGFALLVLTAGATGADLPAQLKDFPRDSLSIQRANGRDVFQVWIADTPARHQQGLMWVRQLAPDQGMLFVLDEPRPFTLWMKNTYLALDMVFLDEAGRVLGIARNPPPVTGDHFLARGGRRAGDPAVNPTGGASRSGTGCYQPSKPLENGRRCRADATNHGKRGVPSTSSSISGVPWTDGNQTHGLHGNNHEEQVSQEVAYVTGHFGRVADRSRYGAGRRGRPGRVDGRRRWPVAHA